ncbi:MAG TPA: aminotransferase class V-fold PLP-dependent enzyme [Candidatus Limnocylindria bacterium]|nr:aminotransferase class V-fold PLP-dependent enzyme [Candidatus Limnocylindria bacterium]
MNDPAPPSSSPPDRRAVDALDAADPLAPFRDRFVVADPGRIYLDGNSLGRLSVDVRDALVAAADDWGARVVEGWPDWIELPARVGDRLAAVALGARPGEVLVADSVTVNLYKLAHAAADRRAGPIVTDAGNFPTDRYVLEGVARQRGRAYVEAPTVEAAVEAAAGGILVLSLVDYRTGTLLDLEAVTRATDALVIWDLCHAAGAVEVDLAAAELAVGCTYKYLNAGPGAPAFLYARRDLQPSLGSPIHGWFGRRDQFGMGPGYDPADGIERFLAGTPSILGIRALDASLGIIEEAGIGEIAARARSLTDLCIRLADAWLAPHGVEVLTPRDPSRRGAHVALRHPDAWPIARALIERAGVVPDFRPPDVLRLGFSPLTTSFADVWDGLDRLRGLLEDGAYHEVDTAARRVT